MPSIGLSGTVQFTASVTGLSNHDVEWLSGGKVGGTSTAGSISTSGLYTAPSVMPGQNPVQIIARSKANSKISATTYVNLLTPGPVLSSVSPNPLPVGAYTVTLQGSGFLPGATVLNTSNGLGIQISTSSVTSNSITASGWQGAAPTATFTVRNPGSTTSNGITVGVTSSQPSYRLTVANGSGGGSYLAGTTVAIKANSAPPGQVFLNWTGASVANSNSANTTLTMPTANSTVTANYGVAGAYVLTVVNGAGSGAYVQGTVVPISANAPPVGQSFLNWTGSPVANPNSSNTTITIPSGNATVTANYFTAPTIPFPVTTHPRLWINASDIPRLQSWATSSNPVYAKGIVPLLTQALTVYNNQFFPNGVQNPTWPDPGDAQGYVGPQTEQYAIIFALNSLIDPVSANRVKYAQCARNLLMVAINQAVLGHLANAPFRDPYFAIYNRANEAGEQWPLIVDWIYNAKDGQGNPILTSSDKAKIRTVFMTWANDCLNAYTTGGDHPSPIGVTNSTQLLPGSKAYRMAANNYYLGHARLLTLMSLSVDPVDDPAIDATAPLSKLGNSLRSYILDATGAWLYQEFAMFGDPSTVSTAFGVPAKGVGVASGGLPPEGMLYGHSFGFVLGQLLALQTAGFNDPTLSGPQIGLIGAPVWDRYVKGYLSSLVPTAQVPASQSWLGPVFGYGSYGDLLRLWVTPDFMQPLALGALLDHQTGKNQNDAAARWFVVNATEGGANALYSRISMPWSYGTSASILYFLFLDPNRAAIADPRPGYPTTFVDGPAGRIVAHSNWSASGSMFDYRASWISINHQLGDGGQFELFRNGEWLTKEMSNYDNNALGMTTPYHNTLGLQNWCANGKPSNLQWYEAGEWNNGSQWMEGWAAGDPSTLTSTGPGYVYAASDLTNLYNRPTYSSTDTAVSVTQATRSIMWLNNDFVVVYDRATSANAGQFKRFHLNLVNSPIVNGSVAVETMPSGQQLFVQSLLPAAGTITSAFTVGNLNPVAQLEPTQYTLTIEDIAKLKDTRFLTVLQGADALAPMTQATHLVSTSGVAFDGAAFGNSAVYFPANALLTLSVTTFTVPSSVHTVFITGLASNTGYGYSIQSGALNTVITLIPNGLNCTSDAGGVVRLSF